MHKPIKKGLGTVLHHSAAKPYPSVKEWASKSELAQFEQEVNANIDQIKAEIQRQVQQQKI